jgi:murein endopeptidase
VRLQRRERPRELGTGAAIGQLEAAARAFVGSRHGRVSVGDISFERGGNIPLHQTHERGLDVDIRPNGDAENQCSFGTNWRLASYDRAATRILINDIRAAAPGHVKLVYFNDPVLIREGLTTHFLGHDDHLHMRKRLSGRDVPLLMLAMWDCNDVVGLDSNSTTTLG